MQVDLQIRKCIIPYFYATHWQLLVFEHDALFIHSNALNWLNRQKMCEQERQDGAKHP